MGAWRLVIGEMDPEDRPHMVAIQEASCSDEQWLGLQHVMRTHGYRGFHTKFAAKIS